ncbi:MAG: LanC-like protein [Actinomycetota bacterium]|nr:LanC-like protein [Actinomycetota bacterium]
MLFSPGNHEPLTDEPWAERGVRERIRSVAEDAERAFDPVSLWPAVEEWDTAGGGATLPLTRLYAGAAGVLWGLDVLRRGGHGETRIDLGAAALRALEKWRTDPDMPERRDPPVNTEASLFFGETGILLTAYRLAPSSELADDLYARVRQNWDSETNELMSGSPGTMLAAKAMLDWTRDERWADAWRESAEELWRRRYWDGFWTYPPYGKAPGASHGIGTNTNVLLQGGDLFPADRLERLTTETAEALARVAVREGRLANWPMAVEDCGELEWQGQIRLQWCHGGAGVVASAAPYLDEELLLAGAELVWHAGPASMEKGPGICHGTAGNGYALLRTFGRTGDERWLERARRFAVHALGQVERWRTQRGSGRYALWTGDVGAALFAADCLEPRTAVPIVDYL